MKFEPSRFTPQFNYTASYPNEKAELWGASVIRCNNCNKFVGRDKILLIFPNQCPHCQVSFLK